jgi:hypothetical protein
VGFAVVFPVNLGLKTVHEGEGGGEREERVEEEGGVGERHIERRSSETCLP